MYLYLYFLFGHLYLTPSLDATAHLVPTQPKKNEEVTSAFVFLPSSDFIILCLPLISQSISNRITDTNDYMQDKHLLRNLS